MSKILVVDDEPRIVSVIQSYLSQYGHEVVTAFNGTDALRLAEKETPDLIVMDIMMPEMDGYEVLRRYRQQADTPVIFLTAKVEEEDKVLGLELGADDYVIKPFRPRELLARIKAVLRRVSPTASVTDTIRVQDITLNRDNREISVAGRKMDLTPSEFDLLWALMSKPGRVFSRLELLEFIQGVRFEGYERTIDIHIKNLPRQAGGQSPKAEIHPDGVWRWIQIFSRQGLIEMRSIAMKLMLAFLVVSLAGTGIFFAAARYNSGNGIRLLEQDLARLLEELADYFDGHRSWEGLGEGGYWTGFCPSYKTESAVHCGECKTATGGLPCWVE